MKESAMNDKTPTDNYQIPPQLLQQLALNQAQQPQGDEIDLAELWRAIWAGKWLIIAITTILAAVSVAYALSLPNIYKSEALLAPAAEEQGGMGGLASKFGGLPSLAGVNIDGGGAIDKTALAIEIMKSRVFITKFIEKHQLLVPLMATKGWNRETKELIYDIDLYDALSKTWVRKIKAPFRAKPSAQEAYRKFVKIVSIKQDKTNSMITISVKHHSPVLAKRWVDLLIDAINLEMKERDLTEAQKSIDYLEKQLTKTKIYELKGVLYQLIEEQTKTAMFANVREQYAFKTIDPALIPELNDSPKRALICLLGVILGGMLGVILVLIRFFSKNHKQSVSN